MPRKFIFGDKAIVAYNRAGKAVDVAPAMNLAGGTVNVMIWGEISSWWGVNSHDVYWALKGQNLSQINVFISSPGGEIDEAFVIHDMLQGHPANVTVFLVGQCASAATIISCSGDEVVMSAQCLYMIHKPSWACWGDSDAMRKAGEILDKYQSLIVSVYKRKTGMKDEALNTLMNEETWFEPAEALALGFVDRVVDNIEVDFLLPTSGTQQQDNEESTFNNANTYRVAACAALAKGLRPANKADIRQLSRTKSNTMFGTEFFTNILDFLQGKKALAKNADLEQLAEELAEDTELADTLQNSAIESAVNTAVAKVKPVALTMESLVTMVAGASDDEKAKIATALNIKPAESKKKTGGNDDEESEDDDDKEEEDQFTALNRKFGEVQAELAKLKKGGSATAPTNGKAPIKPADKGGEGNLKKGQIDIANAALKANQITRDQYKNITGQEPPERVRK